MCKAYQDGIFERLGINDSRIVMVELRFGAVYQGGGVVFEVMDSNQL
jgi:hypothetical protein